MFLYVKFKHEKFTITGIYKPNVKEKRANTSEASFILYKWALIWWLGWASIFTMFHEKLWEFTFQEPGCTWWIHGILKNKFYEWLPL